ncbi:hypothetical protein GOP47_0016343 [Adiantum capillus-veneris]|uniref:Chalcone synthase n=1 Tax=Adiantum capillus-veneris TaxID=13818 RepID=A0A9D4UIE7_ADICA|nr:hypothetical protein GOP47_0016343 [Adiantum capillus-veneris]
MASKDVEFFSFKSKRYEEEAVGLAERAAREAMAEWGGQAEEITHILVYSTSGALSPGLDLRLIKKLGLRRATKHFWVAFNGCHAGVMGIRTAAEIAYSGGGSKASLAPRVLVIWVEINSCQAQSPDPASSSANNIVVASIFGDGAAAAIIAPPLPSHLVHQALFEVHSSASSYIDGSASEAGIIARVRQTGLLAALSKDVPRLIEEHVDQFANTLLKSAQLNYDSVNWVVHPGGRAIVDAVEKGCHLQPQQLELSRRILKNYSNMGAPTILFVLKLLHQEHMRCKRSVQWSFALAFGPGISMEGCLLRLL